MNVNVPKCSNGVYKHLFFDDRYLFERENVTRDYGVPKLVEEAVYSDPYVSTAWPGAWVFRLDSGEYRMLYQGMINTPEKRHGLFCAVSRDGIHFEPEDLREKLSVENRYTNHLVMEIIDGEPAAIIEDPYNNPEERYKLLFAGHDGETLSMNGKLFVSADLLNWRLAEGREWSHDGEPVTGVFYNHKKGVFTIVKRPAWGVRLVGYLETADWIHYSDYTLCLETDSLDEPLSEIYGMPSFSYEDWFIGFPHLYSGFGNFMAAKYDSGFMKAQLAYSRNGTHWNRSLRIPFISGVSPDRTASEQFRAPMVWPSCMRNSEEDITIYACASKFEHGDVFHSLGLNGYVFTYKLRKDGFIAMKTEDASKPSLVATRENAWHGGDVHLNIKADHATVAVYTLDHSKEVEMNWIGYCEVEPGFSHEDCIPFSGDSCDWVPQFKNGKTLEDFRGKIVAFEVRFSNGELYSIYGDMTPLFNIEGERYRRTGVLPQYR